MNYSERLNFSAISFGSFIRSVLGSVVYYSTTIMFLCTYKWLLILNIVYNIYVDWPDCNLYQTLLRNSIICVIRVIRIKKKKRSLVNDKIIIIIVLIQKSDNNLF